MGRKALYEDGKRPTVIHAYCPPDTYERFNDVMVSRGIPESKLIVVCIEKALPQVAEENPVLSDEEMQAFLAQQQKRSYKHKKTVKKSKK